jgi:hypothetical protein
MDKEVRELADDLVQLIEMLFLEQSIALALLEHHDPAYLQDLQGMMREPRYRENVTRRFLPLYDESLTIPKLRELVKAVVCTPLDPNAKAN